MRLSVVTLMIYVLSSASAFGSELFEGLTSVRALGMGNAYLAVVRDADSLFYNPAGLGRVRGFNWTILDPKLGASGLEVAEDIKDVQGDDTFADTLRALYGQNVWLGVSAKSAIAMPYFGVAVFNNLDFSLSVDNPVYTNLDINAVNDFGYVLGAAVPILPMIDFGLAVKRIKRTGSRVPFGPSFVASLDPDSIKDNIMKTGVGYGLDAGVNWVSDSGILETTVSAVWKNIGQTSFRTDPGFEAPPAEDNEISLGISTRLDTQLLTITPSLDYKYANRSDIQLTKKFNFGLELSFPLLDVRGGFHQGYYTAGAGLDFGIIRVDAATYGVELGEYAGQLEDRRYVLQLTIEMGFDTDNIFAGSGGGRSMSPSRRLKQRR